MRQPAEQETQMTRSALHALSGTVCAALLCLALPAAAQDYLGVDAMSWAYDDQGWEDVDAEGLRLRSGTRYTRYFGLELQGGLGLGSDTATTDKGDSAELKYFLGGYARLFLPMGARVNLYGLGGVTYARAKFHTATTSSTESDTGLSFGAGLEFRVSDRFYVGADYMRYLNKADYTLSAISLGGRVEFGR